jgi:hypothetical protein
MYSLTDLGKSVADIVDHNKSGVLMVSGQGPSQAAQAKTFTLRFESGDVARLSGPGNIVGQEALLELLALEQLTSLKWYPLNASEGWTGNAQIDRKDLSGLLSLAVAPAGMSVKDAIQAGPSVGSQASSKQAAAVLVKRVYAVFMSVYLGDTKADLTQVAKLHPPATEPEAYIEACIHLLEPMLGAEAARSMLSD